MLCVDFVPFIRTAKYIRGVRIVLHTEKEKDKNIASYKRYSQQ